VKLLDKIKLRTKKKENYGQGIEAKANFSSSTQNITIYSYEQAGETVPNPSASLPAVDLRPEPVPPGMVYFPTSGNTDTPSPISSSSLLIQTSTPKTPPVYTPLKAEQEREPESGEIIFVRLDTPCYVCGSFDFWEFLNLTGGNSWIPFIHTVILFCRFVCVHCRKDGF